MRFEARETAAQKKAWGARGLCALVAASPAPQVAPKMWVEQDLAWTASGTWNVAVGPSGRQSGPLSGRMGGRDMLARRGQGDLAHSITSGLDWLVEQQAGDGGWQVTEGDPLAIGRIGSTALALLAILGDGHTMRHGSRKNAVKLAVRWLRQRQDRATGGFALDGQVVESELDHALATLAMVEAFGVSKYKLLTKNAQLAVDHLANSPRPAQPTAAAWRDEAFHSARLFRLRLDDDRLQAEWRSVARGDDAVTTAAAAAGIFGDCLRGCEVDSGGVRVARLLAVVPKNSRAAVALDPMTWYFASHGLYQVGGNRWKAWSAALSKMLAGTLASAGADRDAWTKADAGHGRGPVATTALLCLAMESFYRYPKL